MKSKLILCLALVLSGGLFGCSSFAQTAVKDLLTPAAPESVRISGRLGEKLDLCVARAY